MFEHKTQRSYNFTNVRMYIKNICIYLCICVGWCALLDGKRRHDGRFSDIVCVYVDDGASTKQTKWRNLKGNTHTPFSSNTKWIKKNCLHHKFNLKFTYRLLYVYNVHIYYIMVCIYNIPHTRARKSYFN